MYLYAYRMLPLLLLLCVSLYEYYCCVVAVLQLLPLLFVIVCVMENFVAGSLSLIPAFSSSSFKYDSFFVYPLPVPALCRIFGLDLLTSSVITGLYGANAAVSPPWRSPPCILDDIV